MVMPNVTGLYHELVLESLVIMEVVFCDVLPKLFEWDGFQESAIVECQQPSQLPQFHVEIECPFSIAEAVLSQELVVSIVPELCTCNVETAILLDLNGLVGFQLVSFNEPREGGFGVPLD